MALSQTLRAASRLVTPCQQLAASAEAASPSFQVLWKRSYAAAGSVISVNDDKEFKTIISNLADKGQVAIVDFTAKWCGPCRMIAPHFDALSKANPQIKFVKIDIDNPDLESTVKDHAISGVPTFTIYKGAQRMESFTGARLDYLKECVTKYGGK